MQPLAIIIRSWGLLDINDSNTLRLIDNNSNGSVCLLLIVTKKTSIIININ